MRARAFAAAAVSDGLERVEFNGRLIRQNRVNQNLEVGSLVQRGLHNLGFCRSMRRVPNISHHSGTCRTDRLDICPVPQENRLVDDGFVAAAFRLEKSVDGPVDEFRLLARAYRRIGGMAVEIQFPGFRAFKSTHGRRAAVELDYFNWRMRRHRYPSFDIL